MSYFSRKRPRLNSAGVLTEDIWGDDLTEDQLEELDVIASQAYSQVQASSSKTDPAKRRNQKDIVSNKSNRQPKENYTLKTNYISDILTSDTRSDNFTTPSRTSNSHIQANKTRLYTAPVPTDKLPTSTYTFVSHVQQGKEDLIRKLKDELETEKEKNKKLEEVKFAYTGEVTLLRESRERLERLLEEERRNSTFQESKFKKEHDEQISQLQKQIAVSQTELQFQTQELIKIQQKCKSLEQRQIKSTKIPEETSVVSTKNNVSPQKTGHNFLSRFAANFQSDGSSPKRLNFSEASIQTEFPSTPKNKIVKRKCPLQMRVPKGVMPESQQVVHILQRLSPGSLICGKLFHSFPDNLRESSTSLMSPISKVKSAVKKEWEPHVSVNSNCIFSAVQGITEILSETSVSQSISDSLKTEGCLRLLPLIEEHLTLYTDNFCCTDPQKSSLGNMTCNSPKTSPSYFSSTSSSSRYSMPSWNSCEMKHLEENAANALHLLEHLVRLDKSVGNKLFSEFVSDKAFMYKNISSRKSIDLSEPVRTFDPGTSNQSTMIKKESGPRPGAELPCNAIQESKSTLQLLEKISFLCSPNKLKLMGSHITRKLIEVLLAIAETAELHHLQRFNPLLKIGFFGYFLKSCDNIVNIQLSLTILKALSVSSTTISLLCSKDDTCVFQCLSDLCHKMHSSFIGSDVTNLLGTVLDFMIKVVEHQPSAIPFGDQTDCGCDSELIQKLILTLREEAEEYLSTPEPKRLLVLKKGLFLLHRLKTVYRTFPQNKSRVENSYVYLICHLAKVFNQEKKEGFSIEAFAIQDLWDFAQDHSDEFSRGANNEVPMEISQINVI